MPEAGRSMLMPAPSSSIIAIICLVILSSTALSWPSPSISKDASSRACSPSSSQAKPTTTPTMYLPISEDVALSSRRCAAARYFYQDVVKDPLAPILAGEDIIASERINQEKNAVYPAVAIRTRWMDLQLQEAFASGGYEQLVLCGAGMDARAYRLPFLSDCHVFELDVKPVLDYKIHKLQEVSSTFPLLAKAIHRVDSGFEDDETWMTRMDQAGYSKDKKTIWVLEGFLYYFSLERAKCLLHTISHQSSPGSLLLADYINDFTLTSLKDQVGDKWLTSTFSSSMNRPKDDLPPLGYEDVSVVVVGEPSANYGLWSLPGVVGKDDAMKTFLIKATTTTHHHQ